MPKKGEATGHKADLATSKTLRSKSTGKESKRVAAEARIEIEPAPNIDERLFLLRYLERMYEGWPNDFSDLETLENSVGKLRERVNRYYDYVSNKSLDAKLTSIYGDLVSAVDEYMTFINNLQKVNTEAQVLQEKGTDTSPVNPTGHPLFDVFAILLQGIWEGRKNKQAASELIQQGHHLAVKDFDNKLTGTMMRAQNAAIELTEKYGWHRGEAGFDLPPEQEERMSELLVKKDLQGVLPLLEQIRRRRPRDPFIAVQRHVLVSEDPDLLPSDLIPLAQDWVAAASLVPSGLMYDEDRGFCLYYAALIATHAAAKKAEGKRWGSVSSPAAAYAIRLWDARERYVPFDPDVSGMARLARAVALAANGQFDEALRIAKQIEEVQKTSPDYAIFMAQLLSNMKKPDEAFTWFEHALRDLGFSDLNSAKKEPNLKAMIRAHSDEFAALTSVEIGVAINFGFFNDDVLLSNHSAFTITNVRLSGFIVEDLESDNRSQHPADVPDQSLLAIVVKALGNEVKLEVDRIGPGETYKWVDAISIRGSHISPTWSYLHFTCDQDEDKWQLKFTDSKATSCAFDGTVES